MEQACTLTLKEGNAVLDGCLVLRTAAKPLLLVTQQKHSDNDGFTFSAESARCWLKQATEAMEPWKGIFDVLYLYTSDKRLPEKALHDLLQLCDTNPELLVMDRLAVKKFLSTDLCYSVLSPLRPENVWSALASSLLIM